MSEILGIFGIDIYLLIAQTANFAVVLAALWYFLYRPVTALLEKRQHVIKEGVANAEIAKSEREQARAERDGIIAEATHEGAALLEQAKTRAQEHEALALKEAAAKSERVLEDARARAEAKQRELLASTQEEIAAMIVMGAEKVLRERKS